jgi:hypothetical protein
MLKVFMNAMQSYLFDNIRLLIENNNYELDG